MFKRFNMRRKSRDAEFDEEAHKLFAKLNLDAGTIESGYHNLDAVWQHPDSGAKVYIGNQTAARDRSILNHHGITHVVNCTVDMSNFLEKDQKFHYYRFPISYWFDEPNILKPGAVIEFYDPVYTWIMSALENNHNVLIHCLAGAHRAGTTGTLFVMRAAQLDLPTALSVVKAIRPVVNPIGSLKQFATRYNEAHVQEMNRAAKAVECRLANFDDSGVTEESKEKQVVSEEDKDITDKDNA